MTFRNYLAASAAGVALASFSVAAVHAQETTSSIRGMVVSDSGAAVPDATIRIIDTRTGTTRTVRTSSNGNFSVFNVNVGGPYSIEVSAPGYQPTRVEGVGVVLGDSTDLTLPLSTGDQTTDVVVVTASADMFVQTASGPSATFTYENLQSAPAINRDLKDIVRQDPRIYLDESFNDAIQCAGAHPRYNSLTVDSVQLNDGFGLNSNGYPTQRMPFPYDAIQNVSVELAPFDVQYGGFTACNINAVTQSGTNEFHGALFYDYTDDTFQGDSLEGSPFTVDDYVERRYGMTLGGPIVEDHVFFFFAYEKFEGPGATFDRGPEGSGAAREIAGFTQADYDEILDISQNIYGYDPGGVPVSGSTVDEKYLARIDVNLTERHRAAFTYNYNEGLNLTESDGDDDEFEYSNHLYRRGGILNAYTGQLFSDWTNNFSTEARLSYNDVEFLQQSVNGSDFGEVQISHNGNTIYLGTDDSRHSNALEYSVLSAKLLGRYSFGDHLLTVGGETQEYDIFNLFVQESEGEFRFDSIDDFRNGTPNRVIYENATGTNVPADGAGAVKYRINTLYAQDEWSGPNGLNITGGLRYDFYTTDDVPRENAGFLARYGFSNSETLDGKGILQPRVGFDWELFEDFTLRGGLGLYSGGNPNVWLTNTYQNNGVTLYEASDRTLDGSTADTLFTITNVADEGGLGRPIWGIPENLFDEVANAAVSGPANALDPDFDIPAEWKFALGFTYDFDLMGSSSPFTFMGDLLYTDVKAGARFENISLTQIATAPDGRPIYDEDTDDFLLTNAEGGSTLVLSAAVMKSYDFWDSELDWSLAYAFVDAEEVTPMTSSVASSNFGYISVVDPNNPELATSNYEIPHRFTGRISWSKAFFGDNLTRVTLFGQAYQTRASSFTFSGGGDVFGDDWNGRHLLYVPTSGGDPNVFFCDGTAVVGCEIDEDDLSMGYFDFDETGFNAYVDEYGLERGAIQKRNAYEGGWFNKFDLRLEQEFPGFVEGNKTSIFMVMENVGNFLNDDWGVLYQSSFPQDTEIVETGLSADGSQYTFKTFSDRDPESRVTDASVWSVRFGVRYEF